MMPRRQGTTTSALNGSAQDAAVKADDNSGPDVSRIYLIRHGDRYDYANPEWIDDAEAAGALATDPPLSALGHRQAGETAESIRSVLKDVSGRDGGGISSVKIISSPYLRVIQTAVPTSDALGAPICVEEGLSEARATPGEGVLPSCKDRFAYFPHVDVHYQPLLKVEPTPGYTCRRTGHPCEAFAGRFAVRMGEMARRLEEEFRGKTIVCFSHAASVALVAALLRCSMRGLKFAPCGIYELRRVGDGPWEMVRDGSENQPHVSENSLTTYPWGFEEKHFQEEPTDGGSNVVLKRYHGSSEGIGLDYFIPDRN